MPDEDRSTYSEGIRRGGYLLSVQVPDGMETRVQDSLERSDPIDLDERATSWKQEGWTGGTSATGTTGYTSALEAGGTTGSSYASGANASTTGTAGYTDTSGTAGYADTTRSSVSVDTTAATGATDTDETLQLTEEELRVGKRQAAGGRVRVRTYVTERPVEEQVDLRSERVTIERRPVNQEVAPGVAAFQERTIEAVERGEEAVVSKTARVKEEIALHKDVETQTETVHDTVRSMDVEIEDDRTGHGLATSTDPTLQRDKT
jgi:uncharacterized protein (TIGR02271 family)